MGTPPWGCKALSIFTNGNFPWDGLPDGRSRNQLSLLLKPLKRKRLSQSTLQIYSRTLQEHGTSINSVPCEYLRYSLRNCANPLSRWVVFADFVFLGFRFFVRLVKLLRAFVNETTARLRCVWGFVKLCYVTYVPIFYLSHMAIMCHHERGSKDILRPHTVTFACWTHALFRPWTAELNNFSSAHVSGLRDEHADIILDAMVARDRRCESILRAIKTSQQ